MMVPGNDRVGPFPLLTFILLRFVTRISPIPASMERFSFFIKIPQKAVTEGELLVSHHARTRTSPNTDARKGVLKTTLFSPKSAKIRGCYVYTTHFQFFKSGSIRSSNLKVFFTALFRLKLSSFNFP